MTINILNEPNDAKDYEFVVAVPYGTNFLFVGKYEVGHEAEEAAQEVGGIVFHNCLIQGKRRKKKYKVTIHIEKEVTGLDEYDAEKSFFEWFDDVYNEELPNTKFWKMEEIE